jgi:hypothetical protein
VLFTFPSRYLFAIGLPGVFSLARWSWLIQSGFLVPRPTQVAALYIYLLTCTGLSPSQVGFSKTAPLQKYILSGNSYYLRPAETSRIWAIPISLAATLRITVVFFSSGYLDVSVPRVSLPVLSGISKLMSGWVVPFGYLRIKSYLPIPADFRSLSRPSSPPEAQASSVRPL